MLYQVKGTKRGVIFCIHGNSSSSKVFGQLLNSDKIPNTKVSIDLNGHGNNQNENQKVADFSIQSHKEYVLKQLSKIDDDILLIGNSLGGHIAIEIADKVKKLKGLIIMGTPPVKKPINFEEAFIPVDALNTFLTENPSEKEIHQALEIAISDKSKIVNSISDFIKANPLVRKATLVDITGGKFQNQFSLFTKLNVPKYIIAGNSDPSVNRDYLKYVKDNCNSDCEVFDISNCGHFPSIDKSNEFIEIVRKVTKKVFTYENSH